MRRRYQNDIKLYEYVINSNCIGGVIFVDGENVGTVSPSPFIYITPKPIISSISISGGVPPDNRELIDYWTENKTEIEGLKDLNLTVKQNGSNSRMLDVLWTYGPFYRASTPITCKKYKIYHNHAPESVHNASPGVYNLDYTYETTEEITETPGTAVREQLVPYDTTWHLNVVGGNVECMIQPSIEYKISVVAMVGVSSVIQDNSYVVFESDICLRLTVPTTNERLPDTNMIKQLRYDF